MVYVVNASERRSFALILNPTLLCYMPSPLSLDDRAAFTGRGVKSNGISFEGASAEMEEMARRETWDRLHEKSLLYCSNEDDLRLLEKEREDEDRARAEWDAKYLRPPSMNSEMPLVESSPLSESITRDSRESISNKSKGSSRKSRMRHWFGIL